MAQWSKYGLSMKIFVREHSPQKPENTIHSSRFLPVNRLSGEEAKGLYEDIVHADSNKVDLPPAGNLRKRKRKGCVVHSKALKVFKNTDIFVIAQNNEVGKLKQLLQDKDVDVNITDEYGWTALMCAACSGAEDAVRILLENGANARIRDKAGRSAITVAKKAHLRQVINSYKDIRQVEQTKSYEMKSVQTPVEPFYCELCKETFNVAKIEHETSTVHLFNMKPKQFPTYYGIPDTNRGFQLLLREGWDREKGLGPDGSGMKYPIKTKLKNNRYGVGSSQSEKRENRETHNLKYENKRKRRTKEMRDKEFERNFRLEFS